LTSFSSDPKPTTWILSFVVFSATAWPTALAPAKERLIKLKEDYKRDLGTTQQAVDEAFGRISLYFDLAQAVADADLVIEAIPEVVKIKAAFYQELGRLALQKTVFATNSSTLLPSRFAEATGRPGKFLALHFANSIWKNTTAEIMKHPATDQNVFQDVIEFAKAIGMVALPLNKEQPGYILNSLLIPLLGAALILMQKEVADAETMDKTWMMATGAPAGPFAILDAIGTNTAYNVIQAKAQATGDPEFEKLAISSRRNTSKRADLAATGQGFYDYPNPTFARPDFLKNR
jgi:3-hydroxyacyl-CoA dehydrogenase